MKKRAIVLFTLLLFLFSGILLQVYRLSDTYLSQAADQQRTITVKVANSRGTIYDSLLRPLVNGASEYRASITPGAQAAAVLSKQLDADQLEAVTERLQSGKPAVVTLKDPITLSGSNLFQVPVRYNGSLPAPHLLGYMDSDGLHGMTGVELAFDEYLNRCGGSASVTYTVDAMGRPLQGVAPVIKDTLENAKAGVVLSLDADIQKIAEAAARQYMTKGAVVVMEPSTGRILAMASLPDFQPDTVAQCVNDEKNSPLLNRALCNYNLGSVFKITSTAAALEKGIPTTTSFSCAGQIQVGTVKFHCHNRLGHGLLDMFGGFEQSCNPYFIQLMQQAGGHALYDMAVSLGFDRSLILAEGLKTARATLPSETELLSPAAVANLSFGQGSLLGTPVHVAQMVAAVVNDGQIIRPTILKGYMDTDGRLNEETASPPQTAFSAATAQTLRELMIKTVEEGTGKSAKPTQSAGMAGGKTGTAETGWETDGKPVVQSWFGGFYPADNPRYVIAVVAEDADNTKGKSAPVFKRICDELYMLEQSRKSWMSNDSSAAVE